MTLEERVEALERTVATVVSSNRQTEALSNIMREAAAETIKNASHPGRMIQLGEEAANLQAAEVKNVEFKSDAFKIIN